MKIKNITDFLLKQYPLSQQEEWDESGFLNKGNLNQKIKKIFVCLDLNAKVIDKAIEQGIKLIISHHPIFTKDKSCLLTFNKKLIHRIKTNKLTVLSLHTCFDNSNIGMNFLIAEKINLKNTRRYKNSNFVVGSFSKSLSIQNIANLFKKTFHVSLLKTNVGKNKVFNKIAICAGSGLSVLATRYDELCKQHILLVTGDIKHHGWQDLSNYKLAALDVGHDIENCFSDFIANLLYSEFKVSCVAITTSKREKSI